MGQWPIFVISLSDAVRRRQPLLSALSANKHAFTVVDAVDGRHGVGLEFSDLIDRDLALRRLGRDMTDVEFACALSHMRVYQMVVASGLPGALILEDDAILMKGFSEFLRSGVYAKARFVQLDYGWARVWKGGVRRPNVKGAFGLARLVFNAGLATGYSISREGCQFMLDNSVPISLPADWPCDLRPLGPLVTVPRLVQPPPSGYGSHISKARQQAKNNAILKGKDNARERWTHQLLKRRRSEARNPPPWHYPYPSRFLSYWIRPDALE